LLREVVDPLIVPLASMSRRRLSKLRSSVRRSASRFTATPRRAMSSRDGPIGRNGRAPAEETRPGSLYGPCVQV